MLNVFIPHLSVPAEKAVVYNFASKPRKNLQAFGQCLQFNIYAPEDTVTLLLACKNYGGEPLQLA
jgi:hypothetical protein